MMRASLPLNTASLVLRPFRSEDAPRMLALSHEDAYRTWLPSQTYRDEEHALSTITSLMDQFTTPGDPRKGAYVLAIEHRSSRTVIGHIGFSPYEHDVEIGFAVAQVYQQRGLAVEAIVAACSWIFQAFELKRILGIAAAENVGSGHTLARVGFAHLEDKVMNAQGTVQTVSVYALVSPMPTLRNSQDIASD